MPTTYPKCSPSEVTGLVVLLNSHGGDADVAALADDLDLEIDEILPSVDFAGALGLVGVSKGNARLTDLGRKFLAGSIRERKALTREQLRATTLFRALMRALESAPGHRISEEQLRRLVEFTTAPSDEVMQNIINWGRYAELFRYLTEEKSVVAIRRQSPPRAPEPPADPKTNSASAAGEVRPDSGAFPPPRALPIASLRGAAVPSRG